jgi:hypothetical protein
MDISGLLEAIIAFSKLSFPENTTSWNPHSVFFRLAIIPNVGEI